MGFEKIHLRFFGHNIGPLSVASVPTERHPLPDVHIGRNAVMFGDLVQVPVTRRDGMILVPVQSTRVGPDGECYSPVSAQSFFDVLVLMGRWRPDGSLAWTVSERVSGDPDRTTRGVIEPTLAELDDGSLLMVMRGSNATRPHMPGWRWAARSYDGGETWSTPEPWAYTDSEAFYSPSACSRLLTHSDGRLFWLGNICPANPNGNSPRYPFVIGEVDRGSGLLIRNSVGVVDDRAPDESPHLTLSNFYAREDRETGGIVLHLTRLFARDFRLDGTIQWTADAMVYRVAV